jgi:hypothetical protein
MLPGIRAGLEQAADDVTLPVAGRHDERRRVTAVHVRAGCDQRVDRPALSLVNGVEQRRPVIQARVPCIEILSGRCERADPVDVAGASRGCQRGDSGRSEGPAREHESDQKHRGGSSSRHDVLHESFVVRRNLSQITLQCKV